MLETFEFPAIHLVLILADSNLTTGLVMDCGATVCYIVPVYEGRVVSSLRSPTFGQIAVANGERSVWRYRVFVHCLRIV